MDTNLLTLSQDYWASDRSSPQKMYDSWDAPHRAQILMGLACVPGFDSIYELGAGAGPNLRLIRQQYPNVRLGGSDSNPGLAAYGSEQLGVTIDPRGFPHAPNVSWDVALTCYALAYADYPTVRQTLLDTKTQHLIIMEPNAWVTPFAQPGIYTSGILPLYAHDYLRLLADTGWDLTWRWPLYPHHQGLNAVLVAEHQ